MRNLSARCVGLVCVVVCATAAVVAVSPDVRRVQTDDRNGDGAADRWRTYDRSGRLIEIDVDRNFDGRSDVQEYFDTQGALVRRESDRNFNGQVDLVEEFDPMTHDRARSVVDVDYDGRADLLVLFRNGQPVFSKYARPLTADVEYRGDPFSHGSALIRSDGATTLAPLADPFRTDTTVRAALTVSDFNGYVGLATSGGLPQPPGGIASPAFSPARLIAVSAAPVSSFRFSPRSPRGPPLS